MPGGRPKKTVENTLDKGWDLVILSLMTEGASIIEICVELGISKDLHYRWLKDEPEYSDAIKKGIAASEAWWMKNGRIGMFMGKEFNHVLWYMNMKNRFGWKDKQEISGDPNAPLFLHDALANVLKHGTNKGTNKGSSKDSKK